jgi:hypothetical protein
VKLVAGIRVPVAWFDIVNFPYFQVDLHTNAGGDGPNSTGEVDFSNTAYLPPLIVADEYGMPVPALANLQVDITGTSGFVYSVTTTQPAPLGDYNVDGVVDEADYVVWRKQVGQTDDLDADGNLDGVIDDVDYEIWRRHFGQVIDYGEGGVSTGAAAPEPGAGAIALVGMLLVAGFQRRGKRAGN